MDQARVIALHGLVQRAAQLDLELNKHFDGPSPLRNVLHRARERAIEAVGGLIYADPTKPEEVMQFQNEVRRFIDLVDYCQDIVRESDSAVAELAPDENEELRALLFPDEQPGADA